MAHSYVICGTPRSGSTLLCGLLADAGAGAPDSFFRRQSVGDWAEEWGLTPGAAGFERDYVDAAIREGKGGTEVFGLRLMRENLEEMLELLDRLYPGHPTGRGRIEAAFGPTLFLHLSRRDRVAQAISRVKAEQTGLWHIAPDGREVERLAPPAEPRYDFARIRAEVDKLERFGAAWEEWFAAEGIAPLRLVYEDFSADPGAAVARICAALGLPAPGELRPGVARLSDAVSAEWARRYRAEAG